MAKDSSLTRDCLARDWCSKIIRKVKHTYGNDPVHGFPHVERVYDIAIEICRKHQCDETILLPCILLHDIGRAMEEPGKHHAYISSVIAEKLLGDAGFDKKDIDRIKECIETHSYTFGKKPGFLEAYVVSDADKIDAIGAVGVARAFIEGYKRNRGFDGTIGHFMEKLVKLKDLVYLEESRRIAIQRHRFMLFFLREFCRESPRDCNGVPRELLE